jgi:hypothetical protein
MNGREPMDETPQAKASSKTKREMKEAVNKVIEERKSDGIATKEAEEKVAEDLNEAAHKDTNK